MCAYPQLYIVKCNNKTRDNNNNTLCSKSSTISLTLSSRDNDFIHSRKIQLLVCITSFD